MIKSIECLDAWCDCGERANFRIMRTNDELPDGYVQQGERAVYYCRAHMPVDARHMWGLTEADAGSLVQPYEFGDGAERVGR